MAEIKPQMIKELRDRTQAGMSDCKAALIEADGDTEKAVEILKKKGQAKSDKRASAAATEGEVRAKVLGNGSSAIMVEVNIQTDFSARNENFTKFVDNVFAVAEASKAGEDIAAKPYPGVEGKTVEEFRKELSGTIGENIVVRRWVRFDLAGNGLIHSYVHMGGKIGVLIEIAADSEAVANHAATKKFADDVAMQIAAMNPQYVERSEISAAEIEKQVVIFKGQLAEENKPEAAWPKIIEGKKAKWYTEVCLVDQESVLAPGSSIDKVRAAVSQEAGGNLTIRRFARYERGEGIEKKSDDFAAEVAKMAGN